LGRRETKGGKFQERYENTLRSGLKSRSNCSRYESAKGKKGGLSGWLATRENHHSKREKGPPRNLWSAAPALPVGGVGLGVLDGVSRELCDRRKSLLRFPGGRRVIPFMTGEGNETKVKARQGEGGGGQTKVESDFFVRG